MTNRAYFRIFLENLKTICGSGHAISFPANLERKVVITKLTDITIFCTAAHFAIGEWAFIYLWTIVFSVKDALEATSARHRPVANCTTVRFTLHASVCLHLEEITVLT